MRYTVHQLAQLSGVSIRTLHYYDEISLLKPSFIAENGYRYYEEKELIKLQQILFFKELEFSLKDINRIVNAPNFEVLEALKDQKQLIQLKKKNLEALLITIQKTMNVLKNDKPINDKELYDAFSDETQKKYQEEAKQRWGHTDAYKQSIEKTKHWTKKDYDRIKLEGEELTQSIADVMDLGFKSVEVQSLIDKHYHSLRQFYEPNYEMYRGLGRMYVEDKRFTAYYERFHEGLAQFMSDAIAYYCDAHE